MIDINNIKNNHFDVKRITIILSMLLLLIFVFINVFIIDNNYIDNFFAFSSKYAKVFSFITRIGDWYSFIVITLLVLVFFNKKYFKYIGINLAVITVINQLLKIIIRRSRPVASLIKTSGYSFPSGHAMVSMAYYGFIIYLVLKSNIKNKYKCFLIVLLSAIILLIGFSRIYLSVHYLTDVIAGFSISIIYLTLFTYLLERRGIFS